MGRRQSCQLKPDSPPWSSPPPQEQPQPHEAEDFPWSWACSEVQPPAGVQAHEESGELLAESGALLKESAPVLIKNGARSAARAAARAETQRPAAEKDEGRRGVDMMKSIEGGGANGESFGRAPQRGEGSVESGRSVRRRRGGELVFVPFHRRCASGLGCRSGFRRRRGDAAGRCREDTAEVSPSGSRNGGRRALRGAIEMNRSARKRCRRGCTLQM